MNRTIRTHGFVSIFASRFFVIFRRWVFNLSQFTLLAFSKLCQLPGSCTPYIFSHGFGADTHTHAIILLVIAFLFNLLRMSTGFWAHNVCSQFFFLLSVSLFHFCFSPTRMNVHVKCTPKICCHSLIHKRVFLLKCKMLILFISSELCWRKTCGETCVWR